MISRSRTLRSVAKAPTRPRKKRGLHKIDIAKAVGRRIHEMRRRQGLSQEDLAFAAGLHRSYISDVERGTRATSLDVVERISIALGAELTELLDNAGQYPDAVLRAKIAKKVEDMPREQLLRALRLLDAARFA